MRILKRLPPFSWSGGYWKMGLTLTAYGYFTNLAVVYLVLLFGIIWQPILYVMFSASVWVLKPLLIDNFRPCSDCPRKIE